MSPERRRESRIAYFTMEIGLTPEIPTYSGGLGVLAGDTIKSAADLSLPMVAVTLLTRKGYFRQELLADGSQVEHPVEWDPAALLAQLPNRVTVEIEGRRVLVGAWRYDCKSLAGGTVPVYFLDTDMEGNRPHDRVITHSLYGGDRAARLKQEIVLGIGGARMLNDLDIPVRKYHMNEGHSALLTLQLLQWLKGDLANVWDESLTWDPQAVRERCVFTTHTPIEAGHDRFDYALVKSVLGDPVPEALLRKLGGEQELNLTLLALNLSAWVNGVAKRHGEVSRDMFPGYQIHAITNGVHSFTWTCDFMKELLNRKIPGWANEPELLVRVDTIADDEVWEAHRQAKARLVERIEERTGRKLSPDLLTLGFARRATSYKRADLLLSDPERLARIAGGRLQVIYAGKAHPADEPGKEIIRRIHRIAESLRGRVEIVYLPDYDMKMGCCLTAGVDVWVNTPLRPLEASGTSGMKAAHNGVPNFSVLDGWWIEGHIEGVTGWSIGPAPGNGHDDPGGDAEDLYQKLSQVIMPLFYDDRAGWVRVMKDAIGKNAYYFNSHRMMRRYVTDAYLV